MRFNNYFKSSEAITLILPLYSNNVSIKLFNIGQELSDLPFTKESVASFTKITIPALNKDGIVIVEYETGIEFIRVGEPPIMFFIKTLNLSKKELSYKQYNFNGKLLSSGSLTKIKDNIYFILVTNVEKSFFYIMDNIVTLTLPEKYNRTTSYSGGTITLQRGKWQIIAIPEDGTVKERFLDRLAKQEGVDITSLIEVVAAYPGQVDSFLTFIPGFTNVTSKHNFKLTTLDGSSVELVPFWVKCKEWKHTTEDIVYSWSNATIIS